MSKCEICKNSEAIWAMQFIAEDKPTFYTLGSHIRGFKVTKVCSDHHDMITREWDNATSLQRKDFSDWVHQGMLYPLG